jgi:hypothetical protein
MMFLRPSVAELTNASEMPAARPKAVNLGSLVPSPCKETSNAKGGSSNAVLFS